MVTVSEIPLSDDPQTLSVTLGSTQYNLRIFWCEAGQQSWLMDLMDSGGNPIACGLPLVTGTDIIGQFKYLGIGGSLVATTDGSPDTPPAFDNLGSTSHLYFITN